MNKVVLVLCLLMIVGSPTNARQWYSARTPRQTRQQAKPVVPVVLTPAESAAKALLDQMANRLNRSNSVTFDASISYPVDVAGNVVLKQASVSTTLGRTSKLSISVYAPNGVLDGNIVADGSLFQLFDSPTNQYVPIRITPDLWSLEQALELAGKEIYPRQTPSGRDLRAAIGFPMIYFDKVYDENGVDAGDTLIYMSSSATAADGTLVNSVTEKLTSQKDFSLAVTYLINPVTNLPVEFTQIETRTGGKPVFDLEETFADFKTYRVDLPTSTYSFVPPPGAVKVQELPKVSIAPGIIDP